MWWYVNLLWFTPRAKLTISSCLSLKQLRSLLPIWFVINHLPLPRLFCLFWLLPLYDYSRTWALPVLFLSFSGFEVFYHVPDTRSFDKTHQKQPSWGFLCFLIFLDIISHEWIYPLTASKLFFCQGRRDSQVWSVSSMWKFSGVELLNTAPPFHNPPKENHHVGFPSLPYHFCDCFVLGNAT